MKRNERYVFDTNVLISALLFSDSVPGQAFFESLDRGTILISAPLVEELNDVLGREKFERYLTSEERERFLETLMQETQLVEVTKTLQVCRDPKDNLILELAVDGEASFIITGDQDLLALDPFHDIRIVSPAEFVKSLT